MNLYDNIKCYYKDVEMPGGYTHNLPERLKTIDLYYNSQYKSGKYDSKGFRKFFFNIVKPACDIATKYVDLDTSDILLHPVGLDNEFKVFVMQRRLRQWMKDNGFGKLLNDVSFNYPKYGHVVLKQVKGKLHFVNIHNLRLDPAADSLENSSFVYEVSERTLASLKKEKLDTKKLEELAERVDSEQVLVYECYHRDGEGWERYTYADPFAYADKDGVRRAKEATINDNTHEYLPAIKLREDYVKELPYREVKWESVPGRWLGFGFVEYLEDNQVAENEAENLERKALVYKALNLWQTRDENIGGSNVLSDAENGDILRVESELTPVQKDNADLSAYNNTRGRWGSNTERKTFTSDITTGANLPSRTPLGVANLQVSLATSYFELKRENLGLFYHDIILNDIIPSFQNDSAKEHMMTFAGSDMDLQLFDKAVMQVLVDEATVDYANKTGFFPSQLQVEDARKRIEAQLNRDRNRYLKVPEGFYKNAKYWLEINITGESLDVGSRSEMMQFALQLLGTNPAILQNKTTRTLFFKFISQRGISPAELGLMSETVDMSPVAQGGSMAGPSSMPQMPQMEQTSQLI